jgi:hypothetical protein
VVAGTLQKASWRNIDGNARLTDSSIASVALPAAPRSGIHVAVSRHLDGDTSILVPAIAPVADPFVTTFPKIRVRRYVDGDASLTG